MLRAVAERRKANVSRTSSACLLRSCCLQMFKVPLKPTTTAGDIRRAVAATMGASASEVQHSCAACRTNWPQPKQCPHTSLKLNYSGLCSACNGCLPCSSLPVLVSLVLAVDHSASPLLL